MRTGTVSKLYGIMIDDFTLDTIYDDPETAFEAFSQKCSDYDMVLSANAYDELHTEFLKYEEISVENEKLFTTITIRPLWLFKKDKDN